MQPTGMGRAGEKGDILLFQRDFRGQAMPNSYKPFGEMSNLSPEFRFAKLSAKKPI